MVHFEEAVRELIEVLAAVAIAAIGDVVPGADTLVPVGDIDEEGVPRLRVRQVLGSGGALLVDVGALDEGPAARAIATVEAGYLDRLAEITSGEMLGRRTVIAPA